MLKGIQVINQKTILIAAFYQKVFTGIIVSRYLAGKISNHLNTSTLTTSQKQTTNYYKAGTKNSFRENIMPYKSCNREILKLSNKNRCNSYHQGTNCCKSAYQSASQNQRKSLKLLAVRNWIKSLFKSLKKADIKCSRNNNYISYTGCIKRSLINRDPFQAEGNLYKSRTNCTICNCSCKGNILKTFSKLIYSFYWCRTIRIKIWKTFFRSKPPGKNKSSYTY